jgi:hypothetical protein
MNEAHFPEPDGSHEFLVYVEDHGANDPVAARFWIEAKDKDQEVIPVMSMVVLTNERAVLPWQMDKWSVGRRGKRGPS